MTERYLIGKRLLIDARDTLNQARTERLYPDHESRAYHALLLRQAGRYRRAALDALS